LVNSIFCVCTYYYYYYYYYEYLNVFLASTLIFPRLSLSGFRPGYSGEFVFLETLVIFLIIGSEIIIKLHVNGCEKLYLVLI